MQKNTTVVIVLLLSITNAMAMLQKKENRSWFNYLRGSHLPKLTIPLCEENKAVPAIYPALPLEDVDDMDYTALLNKSGTSSVQQPSLELSAQTAVQAISIKTAHDENNQDTCQEPPILTIDYETRLHTIAENTYLKKSLNEYFVVKNAELLDKTYYNTKVIPTSLHNLVYIKEYKPENKKLKPRIEVLYLPANNNNVFLFTVFKTLTTVIYSDENYKVMHPNRSIKSADQLAKLNIESNDAKNLFSLLREIEKNFKKHDIDSATNLIKQDNQSVQHQQTSEPSTTLNTETTTLQTLAQQPKEEMYTYTNLMSNHNDFLMELMSKIGVLIEDQHKNVNIVPGSFVYKKAQSADTVLLAYTAKSSPFFLTVTPSTITKTTHIDDNTIETITIDEQSVTHDPSNQPSTLIAKAAFDLQKQLKQNQRDIDSIKQKNPCTQEIVTCDDKKQLFFMANNNNEIAYTMVTLDPENTKQVQQLSKDEFYHNLDAALKSQSTPCSLEKNNPVSILQLQEKILNKKIK